MAEDYFSHPRPEVRALVPPTARVVVDVGCGAGALGAALKGERPGIQVRGIELDRSAAARAAEVLDDVAVIPGTGETPASWPTPDCIIFADVLEHMVDPWAALRHWRSRLRDGGYIVVSLPNVGHWSVLVGLWRGRWDYEPEGLLDRGHIRFFTRATAIEMVQQAGFAVEKVVRAIDSPCDHLTGKVVRTLVLLGTSLEKIRRPLGARRRRVLDLSSRQILLRARAVGDGGVREPP